LKIQGPLGQENGLKGIKREDRRKSRKKSKSQKLDHPVCQTELSGFPKTDRVRVGFEILFVWEIFGHI
jgi:hypothetical protein